VKRALIVCPGRGSYERASLGSLRDRPEAADVLAACDSWRADHDRPTVTAMDAAETYQGKLHVAGEHASLLTFACSMADLRALNREEYDVVGVVGNSMGWYTALAASDALPLAEAVRLVDTMGAWQAGNVVGGQVIYPITDDQWREDPAAIARIEAALASAPGGRAFWSIRLGAYAVLGADEAGCKHLLDVLPKIDRGPRSFPSRLPLHSAFHTPLMTEMSLRARTDLADLPFQAPSVPLIDGTRPRVLPALGAPDGPVVL
jgi:[acyl-carrier-protein] S-malonyltransferase